MNTDQIYIDSVQEQINSGLYAHLFNISSDDLIKSDYKVEPFTFLDIGANIGLVSIYASRFCKHIVAVEPAPKTFDQLVANTSSYSQIRCALVALAPVDAFVPFFVNDINFTASSTVNTYGKQIMVEGIKLDTLLHRYKLDHVDVAKIDAEGAEGEALNLDQLASASSIIKTYYIETHNCPKTTWEHKLGTLVGNLARCGYSKMTIDGMAITATRP